jgi:hypothetical protein
MTKQIFSSDDVKPVKKFVRYKDGAELYSMSLRQFRELAEEAEAVYKKGKMVLVNTQIIDEYLELFHVR